MQSIDQQLDDLIQRYESNWSTGYDAFPTLIQQLGLRKGVEVGVAFGGHSGAILERGGVDKLYGVDSYQHRTGYDDPMNLPQPVFDRLAQRVVERLSAFGDRFTQVRKDSAIASEDFDDDALDFVYLDADHSEAGVTTDLCCWASKVREGGIIAGHDYGHRDFPGVKRAVDRYFSRFGWAVNELGSGIWWVQRRALPISYFSPCYNCADWIQSTAQSVLQHNLQPGDEYVLVNDGSTDTTAHQITTLANAHPAVRVIHHKQNKGGGAARNTAVSTARHRLLVCLDSDNRLPDNFAQSFRKSLLRTDSEVLVPEVIRFFKDESDKRADDKLTESHRAKYPVGRAGFADYLGGRCGGHAPASGGNLLFTREAYERAEGFPNDAGALDAWGFGLRLAGTHARIEVVPDTSYWHRCGHDSYWTRHQREGTMGRAATELIKPFLHRVDPADRAYLTGKGAETWYFERSKRQFKTLAPGADPNQALTLREKLATMRYRISPARRQCGNRDTNRLRLVLGLGRSGTTWIHRVLAECGDDVRALAEPLHHLRPKLITSDSPDRLASSFALQLPYTHPLMRAYTDLCADQTPPLTKAVRDETASLANPRHVLVKEVHALLATPALIKATGAKALIILRDPLRVADSIFHCQGLESPYLHHEFETCGDSRMLSWIGGPAQTQRRLAIWERINATSDFDDRRVLSAVWTIAVVQEVLRKTADEMPNRVAVMTYEQAKADPLGTFERAAKQLDLSFGERARMFCEQTQSRDESKDPYSIYRSEDESPSWKFIRTGLRDQAEALLKRGQFGDVSTEPQQPMQAAGSRRCA